LGAHGLLANGYVTSSIGSSQIALVAKSSVEAQEYATRALWHMASQEENRTLIANAGAIKPLIGMLAALRTPEGKPLDLTLTTNGSVLAKKAQALKDAGMKVKGLVAIFSYGFQTAKEAFDQAEVPFIVLSDYDHLIEQALNLEYIKEEELDQLKKWREIPSDWTPS
jgi:hypothetical protein